MTHEVKEEEPNNTGEEETGSNWDDDSESHKTNHEETESNLDREKEFNLDEETKLHWYDDERSSNYSSNNTFRWSNYSGQVEREMESDWDNIKVDRNDNPCPQCTEDTVSSWILDWINSSWDRRTESSQDDGNESNWIDGSKTDIDEESKFKAKILKKKKSPSAAARVSPFWAYAINECGWTGLRGADLADFAGRPGGWPSLRPEERKKYIEKARSLTKKNRAKLSVVAKV